jgi:leader peptidase (prepilin peptidase)/N-methyltransferase
VLLIAAIAGAVLIHVDLRSRRLPDPVVGALGVAVVVPLTAVAVLTGEAQRAARGGLAAAVVGTAYLILALLPRDGLGLGDVKLAAVLGFALGFLGWPAMVVGVVLPHLINGPIALVLLLARRAQRRSALPLGPALLVGALLAVATTA